MLRTANAKKYTMDELLKSDEGASKKANTGDTVKGTVLLSISATDQMPTDRISLIAILLRLHPTISIC